MDVLFWLFVAFAVIAFLLSRGKRKQGRYKGAGDSWKGKQGREQQSTEVIREDNIAERQLTTVKNNKFRKRPLMNKSEYGVFCRLEKLLSTSHRGYRVFSQVSLGEIIGSDDKQAYLAINSKRADFVIIDWSGQPIAVVEYHGSGHFKGDAIVRDAIKREACCSAGIAFIELSASCTDADIKAISDRLCASAD